MNSRDHERNREARMAWQTSAGSAPLAPFLLAEAAAIVGDVARRQRATVALVGGYALQHFGSTRLTGNIDVISSDPLHELEPAKIRMQPRLSFGGRQVRVIAPGNAHVGSLVLVPVDVIVRSDDFKDLYVDALSHTVDKCASLPVVEPEYIAAMKLVAGRRRDDDDLAFLITSGVIDMPKTERIIRKHLGAYALKEFQAFADEARWRASRSEQ